VRRSCSLEHQGPSVGITGDSYDNALAESMIGLFKTEEIHRRGPCKGLEDVEFTTLEWVAWYKTSRPARTARVRSSGRVRGGLL
jgi:transposase InsO family protein